MKKTSIMILLFIFASSVSCIYIPASQKQLCMAIEQEPGKIYKFFYEVNGNNPQNFLIRISPFNGVGTILLTGSKNQTTFNADKAMKVCYVSTDQKYKSVSIDFYTHDKSHLLELAKKSQIYDLHSKLVDVGETLKEIARNQLFQEQRQDFQSKLITEGENTIKSFAMLKIVAIIAVAVGQLFLLRKMLNKNSGNYQSI